MAQDPDDKRAYFQRIVDDITAQIEDGRLQPNEPLPSARKMADIYGVASMTAQRALRELQHLRITYGVPGKGTFVHPDAFDLLRGSVMREPVHDDDPDLRRRVADYLAVQNDLFRRFHAAHTVNERDDVITQLVSHAERHKDLIDETARYQTAHGNFARDPFTERRQHHPAPAPDTQPAKATPRKRARKAQPATRDAQAG